MPGRESSVIRRVIIGAMLLVALAASPAAAQYDFNVNPGEVQPGGTVTVSGQGCQANEEVTVTMTEGVTPDIDRAAKAAGDVIVTTTATADAEGRFTVTFVVPEGTPVGTYSVDAYCGGVHVGHSVVDVVGASTPTTPGNGGGGPIVRTGSDLTGLGMLGAGLLTAGGIILIATRSRRHAPA